MRDAWSLLDMCLGTQEPLTEQRVREAIGAVDRGFLFEFADVLADRDAARAMGMIDTLMRSGKDVQVFLKDFSQHLRQLIAAALGVRAAAGEDAARRLKQQGQRIALATLTWMLERAVRAEGDLRWAAQARTVLTVYALTCCQLQAEDDATALLARVSELERALHDSSPRRAVEPTAPVAEEAPPKAPTDAPAPTAPASDDLPPKATDLALEPAAPSEDRPENGMKDHAAETAPAPQAAPAAAMEQTVPDEQPAAAGNPTPKEVWNGMLNQAKRTLPSVYSMLQSGKYAGYENGVYRMRFDVASKSLASFVMDDERRLKLEQILSELGGEAARFEAFSEETAEQKQSAKERAERDIQALADVFGRKHVTVEGEPRD